MSSDDSIYSLNLSVRSTNALINDGIGTISQLLKVDRDKIPLIKNLGKKSTREIYAIIDELKNNVINAYSDNEYEYCNEGITTFLSAECRNIVETILMGETDWIMSEKLSLEEQEIVNNLTKAVDTIGCEISLEAYNNPRSFNSLILSLEEYNSFYEEQRKLLEVYKSIPHYRLNYQLSNYIKAFVLFEANKAKKALSPFFKTQLKVSDLKNIFREVCKKRNSRTAMFTLLKLLHSDLKQMLASTLEQMTSKYQKPLSILYKRCLGLTLESIAIEISLTRERVRQIEKKAINTLVANLLEMGIDPLMFICADRDGNTVLTIQELTNYMGNSTDADLFAYIMQRREVSDQVAYDSDREFFYLKDIGYHDIDMRMHTIVDLPKIIFVTKVDSILSAASDKSGIPFEILQVEFKQRYQKSCKIYHRGRLTFSSIYELILKDYYPAGIKLYDDLEANRFIEKVREIFGDINLPDNSRAFSARLADISVLCGRGMYIHPSYIKISDDLVQKIDYYITNSERTTFSFNELFETFKEELLLSSNISNRYYLQGVLNYYLKGKYYFTKNLVSKEKEADFGGEIEAFIRDRGEVHRKEIFSEFLGITDIMFSMKVYGIKEIISLDNGNYMHSDMLDLQNEDYSIRTIIELEVENLPISSRKLLGKLWETHTEFLMRNDISTHSKLFGILKYMFEGEFTFSRPYIAKLGADEVTNLSVIKKHLQDYEKLTVSELLEKCVENQLKYLTVRGLIQQLNDEFLRTDSNLLERFEVMEETLNEIGNILLEGIFGKGYIVACNINNYIFYPNIGFSWNAFLLRSIVEKYFPEVIQIIDIPTTNPYEMNAIFVDPELNVENYEELLRSVLRSEHNKEPFISIEDALNWLQSEGLIIGDLPKCLTNGKIVQLDEYGEILIN